MRKLFITSTILLLSICSFSQVKIGIQFSPNLSWNRIDDASKTVENKGVSLKTGGGAFVDYEFSDNYAFHSGVFYTTKGSGVNIKFPTDTTGGVLDTNVKMSLQYLQIPVAIKLFTNEIGTDMRMYFVVGGTINTNLTAKFNGDKSYTDENDKAIEYKKHVNFFGLSALVSAGVEMQLGGETWVFGGLSYNRGLLNIDNKNNGFQSKKGLDLNGFQMYNEYISVDMGLKF